LKILLSFFLIATISLGIGQPPNNSSGKVESNKDELFNKSDVFKNGLLPLPDGGLVAMEPLPLPKEPTPSPEPMPFPQKNKHSEKHYKHKEK
jgi:hypothetical protein